MMLSSPVALGLHDRFLGTWSRGWRAQCALHRFRRGELLTRARRTLDDAQCLAFPTVSTIPRSVAANWRASGSWQSAQPWPSTPGGPRRPTDLSWRFRSLR